MPDYAKLLQDWERDTAFRSDPATDHPSYAVLVAAGEDAVPELVRAVKEHRGWKALTALRAIFGDHGPDTSDVSGQIKETSERWLKWIKRRARTGLEILRVREIGNCQRCVLARYRDKIVFGEGDPEARIMFVGEAPGAQEDATGRPFVGASGKLLTSWLETLGMQREDVFIANTVKCRPPENRDPYPPEKEACSPFLHAQLAIIRPRVLVALGRHAANTLAGVNLTMTELRSAELVYEKSNLRVPIVAIYHPSFVLRKGRGATEEEALADLRRAVALAGSPSVEAAEEISPPQSS
jgi:uracil-DNA glycosylase family 4